MGEKIPAPHSNRPPPPPAPPIAKRNHTKQWEAADAEIKGPSVESTELKGSPLKA